MPGTGRSRSGPMAGRSSSGRPKTGARHRAMAHRGRVDPEMGPEKATRPRFRWVCGTRLGQGTARQLDYAASAKSSFCARRRSALGLDLTHTLAGQGRAASRLPRVVAGPSPVRAKRSSITSRSRSGRLATAWPSGQVAQFADALPRSTGRCRRSDRRTTRLHRHPRACRSRRPRRAASCTSCTCAISSFEWSAISSAVGSRSSFASSSRRAPGNLLLAARRRCTRIRMVRALFATPRCVFPPPPRCTASRT